MWEEEKVRRCAIGTFIVGLVGAVFVCLALGTTNWLVFPPGHFYILTHSVYMGLWGDRACINSLCGAIPETEFRANTTAEWNTEIAMMCATISLVFISASLNAVVLASPRKIFTVLTALFWLLAGSMNLVSVVIFWHQFQAYQERMSWSWWVAMVSTIIFFAVGFTLAVFSCCHRWATRSRREAEDPIQTAPPPVVSYRSEATTSDGKAHDFVADPDMQPYIYGGKAYDSGRSRERMQSYQI